LVFLKFACVLFAVEVKVERILGPNGDRNSRGTKAMTYSNLLAFVYHPLVAGTFGGLMNIAYTVIIFALYLSALCVGGYNALQWGRNPEHAKMGIIGAVVCAGITALLQYAFSKAGISVTFSMDTGF
jgi:hypothetical protein